MRKLIAFYTLQFHLLRRWSGGTAAIVRRGIETVAVSALSLIATAAFVPGLVVRDLPGTIVLGLALVALTTIARPLLIGLLSGISIALVALATVALQGVVFWILAQGSSIAVPTVAHAALAAFAYSLASAVMTAALSLGDDNSFFGTLVRQLAVRHRDAARTDSPGVVLIQLDGVSRSVLEAQLSAGGAPTLARWLGGGMRMDPWEAVLPSQTSASQAGILHGADGIPGFRWWDKVAGRLLISNHPEDAREIERRISDGRGVLANGGASIGNLLSGDATRSYLTAATIAGAGREVRRSHVLDWFFVSPYAYVRWIVLAVGEVLKEIVQARREVIAGIEPRGDRRFPYPLARAATNVILRHLSTALVIEEMYRATPAIYVDFVDYDEIAHHTGPLRVEARDALRGVDRILGLIEKAAMDAPRVYRFVVLSDHGQSPGATFEARYGRSLEALIAELAGTDTSVSGATGAAEHWGRVTSLMSEASGIGRLGGPLMGASFRRATGGLAVDGKTPDIVVAASGNLANVSFPRRAGRVTLEEITQIYPRLVDGLARHPGIGLVMVRSASRGAVVRGSSGTTYLDEQRSEGVDPVAPFGPHAEEALRRLDAMPACADLVIISTFDPGSGEVASFEDQVGSHGGLGGAQTQAFIAHPADWRIDSPLVGAAALNAQIRRWLEGVP
jgi:uncharacterized membrane protein YvlD (DUF360 family)